MKSTKPFAKPSQANILKRTKHICFLGALGQVQHCRSRFCDSIRTIESCWNLNGTSLVTKQCPEIQANPRKSKQIYVVFKFTTTRIKSRKQKDRSDEGASRVERIVLRLLGRVRRPVIFMNLWESLRDSWTYTKFFFQFRRLPEANNTTTGLPILALSICLISRYVDGLNCVWQ